MNSLRNTLDRRQFVQLSALSALPAACLLAETATNTQAAEPTLSRAGVSRGSGDVLRVGTIQTNKCPYVKGLKINPFARDFRAGDLRKSVDGWLRWYEELTGRAGEQQCKLVVLTEDITNLANVMTFLDDRALFCDSVRWQTPRVAQRLGHAARKNKIFVVASYFAWEEGKIFNVADLFSPTGDVVGRYRKVHLPQYELWQVTPGDAFPAFETELGWIGMLICYDQMWPESAACCALNGAQILCQPSAASLTDYHMKTRATDNQVHFISSTYRNSMIASPKGQILADAKQQDPGVVWADVDLTGATQPPDEYYWEELYSGIRDHKERVLKFRHPDAYRVIVSEHPPLANQYPPGGVANTPEAIDRVYAIHKKMMQNRAEGKPVPYHWTS